jgi:non-specific serine/threonine protein kinase
VISVKAGGVGLNLTEACHVIHFDRWWNPAVESQATDRAFRIGQKRNVLVHKFVCRGTLEERIDDMIESKKKISQQLFADDGQLNLTEMSNEELLEFVSLDLDRSTI